jgi:EAL domain-containing protein (putative c-di-GMP-specific phosphodiesterase class I)
MAGAPSGRILVVDDDEGLREVVSELLAEAGYQVTAAANGRLALEALQKDSYDAVFSDVRMPDMDGLGLLRAVRKQDLDLPVVLLTGGPTLETAMEAVEHGALQYLVKPVPTDKLLEAAARAVRLGALARLKRQALAATSGDHLAGDRAGLEASFGRGLAGLWMAYQPIVRGSDGGVQGHEALLRTTEPVFPHPGAFLAAAEQLGRLPDLGRAIRKSVADAVASGALPGDVFVNLHPLDLADYSLLDPGAPLSRFASRVVLEVTERESLDRVSDVAARMRGLRDLGYRIALDDLGAGYAGLNSFVALSPDIVKLDMSLVRGLDQDPVKQKLVGSMTGLCRDLRMQVVAEGVESEGERQAALAAGCELIQGYLVGRPLPLPQAR